MKDQGTEIRGSQVFDGQAGVIEHGLVRVDRDTVRALDNNGLRYCIGNAAKLALILPQFFFRPLEVLNVCVRSVPSDAFAALVTQRLTPEQEPTIFSVVAPQTRFELTRLARSQERPPLLQRLLQVFGMNRDSPSPSL